MNRFDRILAILILLQAKPLVKAQELADKYNVSLRTIYRDVRSLENAGVPIIGEAGQGYSLTAGYRLPPLMFSEDEATALLTAEKLMEKMTDPSTRSYHQSAMEKVKAILRTPEKNSLENLYKYIEVLDAPIPSSEPVLSNTVQTIYKSITSKRQLLLDQEAMGASPIHRLIVEPIGICFMFEHWHLIAFSPEENKYCQFRIDQITRLVLQNETYTPNYETLKSYLLATAEETKLDRIIVSFRKEIVQYAHHKKFFYGYVQEREQDDRVEMTFLATCNEGIARWLLMFTTNVEIHQPPALKEMIKALSADLYRAYH